MPPLSEMKLGHRIALTVVIILIILFALALFGFFGGRWEEADAAEPQLYQGIPLDAHLLPLDRAALEQAYSQHLIRLWNVWLTDGAKEASRITTGLKIARTAYHQAAQQLEKREQELEQRR